jgi:hypothetical protein
MFVKTLFLAAVILFLFPDSTFAQDGTWICPSFEMAAYSPYGFSPGLGLTLAHGRGASIGLKAAYFINGEEIADVLEITFLLRLYFFELPGDGAIQGPWLQFNSGPALFIRTHITEDGYEWGDISAGISFGWRFLLRKQFFIEPFIRGGYPFLYGGGLAVGLHF